MLIGNKIDIEPMEIDELTSKSFAKAHEFDLHFHISCKSNSGIREAFEQLAISLHNPSSPATSGNPPKDDKHFALDDPVETQQNSKCLC